MTDALMTNFHLPKSTLYARQRADGTGTRPRALYRHAVDLGYRFLLWRRFATDSKGFVMLTVLRTTGRCFWASCF